MSNRRADRVRRLREAGLYLVTDDGLPQAQMLGCLRSALEAGARVVQLRAKDIERRDFFHLAKQVQALCHECQALFIVNDAADVAALLAADGLHLGQDDLPADAARRLVQPDTLVGVSISTLEEARLAAQDSAVDYLGVGAMFATETKPEAEYGGLELLRAVRAEVDLPLVAIGGITVDNAPAVWAAGADLVAVVSAVFSADDPAAATQALLASKPPLTEAANTRPYSDSAY
jgi:thiamine-phosphate pyrophosphorylase